MQDKISFLESRRSARADKLTLPAPDAEDIAMLLQAGMSAPDHGAIRPWRFLTISGENRFKLCALFEKALRQKEPQATAEHIKSFREKPLRAPLIIVVIAEITEGHPKVPPMEQIIATAFATQTFLHALDASPWAGVFLSGWTTTNAIVREGLGLCEKDELLGYIHIGTDCGDTGVDLTIKREKKRPDSRKFIKKWPE